MIAAVWLLVLAGSIAALLLLVGLESTKGAKEEEAALQDRLALSAAAETVMADRLLLGSASRWWLLPARGRVAVGDKIVEVEIDSESGRLDLNEASLELIASVLDKSGLTRSEGMVFTGRLASVRSSQNPRLESFEEVVSFLPQRMSVTEVCRQGLFTLSSGRAEPRAEAMPGRLRSIFGSDSFGTTAHYQAEPGAALRFALSSGDTGEVWIGRLVPSTKEPLSLAAIC